MRKIKLFLLGIREFKEMITTHFDYSKIEIYDSGREFMHKVTFRRFEEL